MNVFGKLISSVSDMFDFNQATLSGGVDIVVVRQRDGTLKSTPFHVRFGKLKVLKSKDKFVKIIINNQPTRLKMKLGEAGEGFFEEEIVKIFKHQSSSDENSQEAVNNQMASAAHRGVSPLGHEQKTKLKKMLSMQHSKSASAMTRVPSNGETAMEIEQPDDLEDILLGDEPRKKLHTCQELVDLESPTQIKMVKKIKVKTLRPSSDQLKSLNLRLGSNTVSYTVHTALQGSQTINAHIYFWHENTNIIISDIDGTITKTDFLGHVMPMVGKDWSQPGIAPLYTNIRRNGYQILYLTSRPIGQAQQTKDFLHSVYQDGKMLPHGPLIMSPDRMLPSVKREIVFKRPELFKMAVLKDIRSLFPADHNPFHAGFGNRPTDAIAYNSVGIPLEKVYIVNPKGDIHHHTDCAMKSYALINSMVKEMFPDILRDPKSKLAESLDDENALKIDDQHLMEINVAKVIA
jgi:phosphatidate phosphatase LPIN